MTMYFIMRDEEGRKKRQREEKETRDKNDKKCPYECQIITITHRHTGTTVGGAL